LDEATLQGAGLLQPLHRGRVKLDSIGQRLGFDDLG
jgi:hypothetical protein